MDELETFLGGGAEVAQSEPVASEPEQSGPVRDEHGRFAPKAGVEQQAVEEPQAEPVSPTGQLPKEEYEAVKGERKRRQDAEARLAALERELQELRAPKEPPAPPPSVWEDEQAYGGHIVSTAVQQASLNAHLNMSEMLARREHQDFDAMKASFLEMAQQNPALAQQALSDPDPWGKAYQIAKNAATMAELGATDLATLEAKLREQIKAEMAAQQPTTTPQLPASLADAQSARSVAQTPAAFSLDDILKR